MQIKIGGYFFYFKRRKLILFGFAVFFTYFLFCLPDKLFNTPRSTVLLSEEGELLNAKIANDGQWRFPKIDSVPHKYEQCVLAYEDEDFHDHWGVDFSAISRAVFQNIRAGKVVSGGSTLTMQVARMARDSKRTLWNKIIEVIWAYRIELGHSKNEILQLYASNAPFGGNVVGLEAASWRYYQLPPHQLTWSQCATLAVLPNAPGLIHPGKNRKILKQKRDIVLRKLYENEIIDSMTYILATEESLVAAPKRLPMLANHLMQNAMKKGFSNQRIQTTIDIHLQLKMIKLLKRHQFKLDQNYIHNAALLVIDVEENKVISYVGNSASKKEHDPYVNIINARRSTGSLLKPFLYAVMMQEGMIHNDMLIPDVPLRFDNFAPKNFDRTYDGAVPVQEALTRSLNVPAVYLLEKYGVDKFLDLLQNLDQHYVDKTSAHYGLSLILGGAESSLWDVCQAYAGMAKTLSLHNKTNEYTTSTWLPTTWVKQDREKQKLTKTATKVDAGAIYEVFEAMLEVNRPGQEKAWKSYQSARNVAWKTGTSFGNRDAWAIGCTPRYVVGVWVGNASGEGRPGLIGSSTAGPILFDAFANLPQEEKWFDAPYDELIKESICAESGYRATENCERSKQVFIHRNGRRSPSCNFHQTFLTDLQGAYRYTVQCANQTPTQLVSRFVLPAIQGWYYQTTHPSYQGLPPYHPNCNSSLEQKDFAIIYPKDGSNIVGIRDLDGIANEIILEAAHQTPSQTLFWHIDDVFLGSTSGIHKMNYLPTAGKHRLTLVDEEGNEEVLTFTVLEK